MKIARLSALVILTICLAGLAHAQCDDQPVVYSVSLSPNVISGDESEFTTGTISLCIPPSAALGNTISIEESITSSQFFCIGGSSRSGGCYYPSLGPGNSTVSFELNGYNYGTTEVDGHITVSLWTQDAIGQASITVMPAGNPYEPPDQEPDGPCPTCTGDGNPTNGSAGHPINVTNGDTWIPQQDYSIPGLGGGLSLTRTWNSLWANMNPPAESGIFGDSWRSNFEEYIQLISGEPNIGKETAVHSSTALTASQAPTRFLPLRMSTPR